jgi:glycosyltransferase involved in cell wall biosynthesis
MGDAGECMNCSQGDSVGPPRVLHLVVSLDHGGLEALVVDWVNLRNERCPGSTVVCCLDRPGEIADSVAAPDAVFSLEARRSQKPFDVVAVRRLRRLIRKRRIRVLHSHNLAARQYAMLAAFAMRGVRHVHTEHGSNPHTAGLKNRLRNACLNRFSDAIVAVSDHTRRAIISTQGVSADKVRVILNGVKRDPWVLPGTVPALRDRYGIPANATVVGSVGRLAPVKGYDRLIRAFGKLVAACAGDEVRLILVGDGPDLPMLKAAAAEWGIVERVVFAGFQRDVQPFLSMMNLFVLPSRSEGLSVSLLQAMAAGCIVAVTDVGENRAVVADGRAGVVLPEDERQWPAVLGGVVSSLNGEHAERMRRAALDRVRSEYTMDRTMEAYEEVYRGTGRQTCRGKGVTGHRCGGAAV